MATLSAEAINARRGVPLAEVLAPRPRRHLAARRALRHPATRPHRRVDRRCSATSTSTTPRRRSLYGFDPIRALLALRRQIPYLDSAGFLRELTLLVNRLRDQHTQLYVDAADTNPHVVRRGAALPRRGLRPATAHPPTSSPRSPTTSTHDDIDFAVGARLTTWNGVPFGRSRRPLRRDAHRRTTRRAPRPRPRNPHPTTAEYLPPPDELLGRHRLPTSSRPTRQPDRTHPVRMAGDPARQGHHRRQPDRARAPDERSTPPARAARRARKLLFATALWDQRPATDHRAAKADDWIATDLLRRRSPRDASRRPTGTFGYLRLWTFDVDNTSRFRPRSRRPPAHSSPAKGSSSTCAPTPAASSTPPSSSSSSSPHGRSNPPASPCVPPPRWSTSPRPTATAPTSPTGPPRPGWRSSSARSSPSTSRSATPTTSTQLDGSTTDPSSPSSTPTRSPCGDLFAAGIADYGIGQIVSVGEATGAGGANVWTSDDIQYAYHAADARSRPSRPGSASPSPCDA